jgi:hypothetical protein
VKGGGNAKEEMDLFGTVVGDSGVVVFRFMSEKSG